MSGAVVPVSLHPGEQAGALGVALNRLGFTATVLRTGAHQLHPCVVIASGPVRQVRETEYVYAAPGDDGRWRFWWSWLEPIAPLEDISTAASTAARVLTRSRNSDGQHR